jgi:aminopeptidase-like protein
MSHRTSFFQQLTLINDLEDCLKLSKFEADQFVWSLMKELEKLPRSLLGDVNIEFKKFIQKHLNVSTLSFPSGMQVFDWQIPRAWRVLHLEVTSPNGLPLLEKFDQSMHVVQYSGSFSGKLSRSDFIKQVNSVEELPNAIPYKTSYYENAWGLNLPHSLVESLPEGDYEINLQVEFYDSELQIFEILLPGRSKREVVFHTYFCHPYMANDNNSGVALTVALAKLVEGTFGNHEWTYRFVFVPETIGAIAYIRENLENFKSNVDKIFVLSCLGDDGPWSIVESPYSNAAGRTANYLWQSVDRPQQIYSWRDRGSDERQYAAPGVELPVCTLSRSKFGTFVSYHTFDDNLNFVTREGLQSSFRALNDIVQFCELDGVYVSATLCEPMLSKRQLYPRQSVRFNHDPHLKNLTTFVSLCNGSRSLIDALVLANVPAAEALDLVVTALQNQLITRKS